MNVNHNIVSVKSSAHAERILELEYEKYLYRRTLTLNSTYIIFKEIPLSRYMNRGTINIFSVVQSVRIRTPISNSSNDNEEYDVCSEHGWFEERARANIDLNLKRRLLNVKR